jgi:hypothetical protein
MNWFSVWAHLFASLVMLAIGNYEAAWFAFSATLFALIIAIDAQ